MLAAAPVQPPKKVSFLYWDSDEEGKRSARGAELRRKQKEEKQQKKMAAQAADMELAGRVYAMLIEDSNRGPLDTLARNQDNRFFLLSIPVLPQSQGVPDGKCDPIDEATGRGRP